ncbi:MAG: RNA polymerase sigma factor [Acidimicrobiales bacterium]
MRAGSFGKQAAVSDDCDRLLRALYLDHSGRLCAYAYRCGVPRHDIDDVVAEVFMVAWRKLNAIPDPPGDRLWLLGVARNVIAKRRDRAWRHLRLMERLKGSDHLVTWAPEGHMELRDAIRRLPAREREVVHLVEWEGLSHDEVAVVLGCSANASRIRLHRAKERLRQELQGSDRDEERE